MTLYINGDPNMHNVLADIIVISNCRLGYKFYFTSALTTKSLLRRENKSQKFSKVSSCVQSTTSESLTVPTMQKSRAKNYRIGYQSSKRKPM